ncbi:monovalent cation/H+ antiporter subunit D [Lysobacter arvi]|uniref:Monovalent cation/H+ antiporter subunit D n=1 Tax=Lysobacter arvi TaxID=3038776 RepID=A0ABU1CA56_9GAMM|nr:monovalent cation/H+ antiporter subunit D [Lysobacter arvi]MDR0182069.1 monovalent cation/H+ antiporter subunit D [Lysobacter arvi]
MNATAALIVLPIVLPLLAAAVLLLIRESRRRLGSLINLVATFAGLVAAMAILWQVNRAGPDAIAVHLTSNWAAPFGIALVADRLSALMLAVVGVVGLGAALSAAAGWSRTGSYFHPLFQIQLMGINGAFLTGDLFNLFVFFEVMLAASYGLQLHGSGWPRVRAGMHYIAVNLLASSLFLVGLAVLYGVMGTLSMADVAAKVPFVPPGDRGLLHAGAAILAMAFLIKAAVWPLNAWLVPAYTAASTPVAALFVLMTKVGVYAVVRLWMLLFPALEGAGTQFGGPLLLGAGLATLAFGAIGVLASIRLDRIAAFSVIVTSGTLLASFATGSIAAAAAALFYLVSSTFAVSALFLMVEPVQRTRSERHAQRPVYDALPDEDDNLDDQQLPLVGRAFPVSIAALGLAFMACSLLVAGLPPLSGFLSKAAILTAIVGDGAGDARPATTWILMSLLLCSSLFTTISLVRAGIRHFWSTGGRFAPQLKLVESGAVLVLIGACLVLTVFADPVLRYTTATATYLQAPSPYVRAVFGTPPRPGPTTPVYPQIEPP